ncbi:MAG TPA: YncE family protein [Actinomycetota bacterium]|nr:YncE family protein [Actinomycetota bacterium]
MFASAGVAALVIASSGAAASTSRRYEVTQTTPAGATPHFPAYDDTSGHVLVSNIADGTVTEIDPGEGPVRSFLVGAQPHPVVVDEGTSRGFVVNKGASSVSVLDLTDGATTVTFPVGPEPHGLAIDAGRDRLYVTSIGADRVEAYDLTDYSLVDMEPVGDGPWGVDVRGDIVAVTDTGGSTIHVLDADSLSTVSVVEVGDGPWNVKIGDRATLYATLERAGEVVAVRAGEVIWRTSVGPSPHGIVVDESRDVVLAAVTGSNQIAVQARARESSFRCFRWGPVPRAWPMTPIREMPTWAIRTPESSRRSPF